MPFLALDEWRVAGVHWHAFTEHRRGNAPAHTGDRMTRRGTPHTTLRDPWAVASWIDEQTRQHVHHREVFAIRDGLWVSIGDEDDLEHLRRENYLIASRGDSIYTDIYVKDEHHDLYVEAVTHDQCTHGCHSDNGSAEKSS